MVTEIGRSVSVFDVSLRSGTTIAVPARERITVNRPMLTPGFSRVTSIALWLASVRALTRRARAAIC